MATAEASSFWKDGERPESVEARAKMMLERAHWAATGFAGFDRAQTLKIARAAAEAGFAKAQHFAEWAVRETGYGVVEHKKLKNELCSRGIFEHYKEDDFVGKRVDTARKIVEFARPAGVIFALVPSTNPVSTVFFKIVLALLTRNAIVISPHPMAKGCCADAARVMAEAAQAAGAPDGVIQAIEEPTIPLIEALMSDPRTDVILATGGTAVVRAAYRSGNPAIGVGPGNAPVFVDATADLAKAAKRIVMSKSFDNSILCTNESVLVAEESIAGKLERHLQSEGAQLCEGEDLERLRGYLFPEGRFNLKALGKDAAWIAKEAGLRAGSRVKVLLAPFELAVPEEPFAREKLCPVLGYIRVPHAKRGIDVSRAIMRHSGSGHSAAIHSRDPKTIMAFAANLRALRIAVNSPCSTGAAGFDTHLAPSMTIGTGYLGRSSVGDNIGPQHLVNWTRIAYDKDAGESLGDFEGIEPWDSAMRLAPAVGPTERAESSDIAAELREEIRKVILEELRSLFMGS